MGLGMPLGVQQKYAVGSCMELRPLSFVPRIETKAGRFESERTSDPKVFPSDARILSEVFRLSRAMLVHALPALSDL